MVEETTKKQNVKLIHDLCTADGSFQSPINISLSQSRPITLSTLIWTNFEDVPKKMKLSNTGHTIILSAKWYHERPYLSSGPLESKYVFSQLHFHWGDRDDEGSEHTVDGDVYPLEMHAVFFKGKYLTQESALKEKDGVTIVCYLYKITSLVNPQIQTIVDAISWVEEPHTAVRVKPKRISALFHLFQEDYFLYWGAVMTPNCGHPILYIICRETIGISRDQIESFRMTKISSRNFRIPHPLADRILFHVNHSTFTEKTLLPIKSIKKVHSLEQREDREDRPDRQEESM